MTREEAKELLPIIQAFAEGKTIQYKNKVNPEWEETDCPIWAKEGKYRIKPEPKYRPFKNREECWNEILKHQPLGWIKNECGNIFNIIAIFKNSIQINKCIHDYYELGTKFKFIDGTPFGIKDE